MVANLRDDVRRILREEKVAITGGIGVQPRGVTIRVPEAADRTKLMPRLNQLAGSAGSILGQSGAPAFDVVNDNSGTIQVNVTDAGVTDKIRRAVEQSIEVIAAVSMRSARPSRRSSGRVPTESSSRCRAFRIRKS